MKIKIRTTDGTVKVVEVSKAMLVQEFRKIVADAVKIEPERQRLIIKGKQMEDDCILLDYRIQMGDIVVVTERIVFADVANDENVKEAKDNQEEPPKFNEEIDLGNYVF